MLFVSLPRVKDEDLDAIVPPFVLCSLEQEGLKWPLKLAELVKGCSGGEELLVGSEKTPGSRTQWSLNQKCLVCTLPAAASMGVARTDHYYITRDREQN